MHAKIRNAHAKIRKLITSTRPQAVVAGSDRLVPRLTSVAIPIGEIANRVVGRALRQVAEGPDHDPGEIVPFALRIGQSTRSGPGHPQRRRRRNGSRGS